MESIEIKGDDLHQRIFVGTSGENVHLSMMVPGGSCYMSIDRDEAKRMIKALEQAIQQAIKDGKLVEPFTKESLKAFVADPNPQPEQAQLV